MTYFDNAATTFPKPLAVKAAVDQALVRYGANPGRSGHDLSVETAEQVFGVRTKAAAFFGAADESQIVFTQNCTYAVNIVIKGLLCHGDHVIISDLEHNAVLRPVHALATRGVITYSMAKTSLDDEETVDAFRRLIRPETRAIITTHASNVFGVKIPIEKLAVLARQYGLYFIVDAAQTAGVEPIDVSGMGIDFLCTAGHKSLYGPTGTGLLITALGSRLTPLAEGGTGSVSADYNQPDFMPDRHESGTLNTVGILGLGAGIDFVNRHGIGRIAHYETMVARCIYDEISTEPNVVLYTPAPQQGVNLPVLSFNIKGKSSEETTGLLNQAGFALRGGLHCAPSAHEKYGTLDGGTARISVGAFNTVEQGYDLACAIKRIARAGG
ncbi:aminotransferase class V-fold PLP-dependent enzyme [Anaerotruncus rubiinfantis]|uniref:aminotransferase class V-fold PLP-dependent enzyme n=1 Tax=Anaerotruncus rubiinfantis TaxID=1720200 RepID=UPI00082D2D87|nr:aminotransferase class V-fold PLP-dependent enzyme [Anaerotruncus rubiinfantis]